ncbi:PREDICTED: mRNA cap guanine-N7 methyltransferase 2-like isoform X2 [Camelina sativa]|uniref:mRNA (guanine-N(7))-methyltransferase n=1 Tax=Camelina sativa TaxID=90675 RepID=A0ABM0TIB6_CAMSA|nr:PREDICTED: mRNA cap guanine-N7 methyltransferase 2-like isoform X2 [Camelina sativa]
MSGFAVSKPEQSHHRLFDIAKTAIINIFAHPYTTVCELYCGEAPDTDKWEAAPIGHYIGIASSGISYVREAWESQRKNYDVEFFEADPSKDDLEIQLQKKLGQADLVSCWRHLQLCFETEESARRLLTNVACLLKPGGYFFGITPDSSTIWAKYQKNVEAYHNRSGTKPNVFPNYIRSESYVITFELEEEKFPLFGKRYQLKFSGETASEDHCLVHFPSLIRLAREAGLEYVEIQSLTDFYDDNRAHTGSLLMNAGPNLVDPRGKLLPRALDLLGLYATFIFQKPDPDLEPPLTTPVPFEVSNNHDERELPVNTDTSADDSSQGLGKISEQKGILGPGPADLRFSEAF